MHSKQRGVGLMALIFGLFVLIMAALLAMKILPSFMEFRSAKNAIEAISRDRQATSVADIRRAFENRSNIDNIEAVKPSDLEVSKDGNQIVIAFAYRKEIPLFGNVGLYIDYAANSRGQ